MPKTALTQAATLLANAKHVACLTGAGISAESGISTFRDAETGHWSKFDPQQLASQAGFAADPGLVWRWYASRLGSVTQAQPNPGHLALAQLEALVPNFTLVTQNVDDLHERGGSQNVLHIHGSIARFRCNRCDTPYSLQPEDVEASEPPQCLICTGPVRPDVVWFGESLPRDLIYDAWQAAENCDIMLVVGTSGIVFPAAQLPSVAMGAGAEIIDVNPEYNPISESATVFLQGAGGEILPQLIQETQKIIQQEI